MKENKTITDATLALLKNGDISPTLAMQAVQGLNTGNTDSNEDDLYQMEMLTKINDEIVPERYKPLTTKFLSEMESLKFGLKIDSKKGMTEEQTTADRRGTRLCKHGHRQHLHEHCSQRDEPK